MKQKDIDIIVLTYNRRELLVKVLESLTNQTHTNFNLIVTDDGSKSIGLIDPNQYPIITKYLWNIDDGYHRTGRLNEAMKMCVSPNVIMLDDDVVPQSNQFIEGHLESLMNYPISRGVIQFPEDNYADASAWFSTANIGLRIEAIKSIGYFDAYYDGGYGHEDMDLGEEFKKHGLRNAAPFNKKTLAYHLGKMYLDGDRSWEVIGKNTEYFIKKWGYDPRRPRPW